MLPSTLRSIGDSAFARTGLSSVTVPAAATVGDSAFPDGCSVTRAAGCKDALVGGNAFRDAYGDCASYSANQWCTTSGKVCCKHAPL